MISRTFVAKDIFDIKYFKLLSKFQYHIKNCMAENIFVNRTEHNQNIFVKKTDSKKTGSPGLKECYDYIINNYFNDNETHELEEHLRRFKIQKTKLVYDTSTGILEVIGCSFSKKSFKYHEGCAYTLKFDKNIPRLYHQENPQLTFKKLNDLDEIISNLPSECNEYFKVGLKSIKFEDDLLDDKLSRLREFLVFLNLNEKQKTYCFGTLLKEI